MIGAQETPASIVDRRQVIGGCAQPLLIPERDGQGLPRTESIRMVRFFGGKLLLILFGRRLDGVDQLAVPLLPLLLPLFVDGQAIVVADLDRFQKLFGLAARTTS